MKIKPVILCGGSGTRLFPGLKNLNQYYQNKKKEKYQDIKVINQINKSDKSLYCPIMLGVSFLDQIKKLETLKKCSFQGIAYPILLLPFLSRCSEIIGKKIFLEVFIKVRKNWRNDPSSLKKFGYNI